MTAKGKFIVVEGMEGAGKSTVIHTIREFLLSKIESVILTREPGGTRIGEKIREIIKENYPGETLASRSELLLMYAARVQLLEELILPALNKGSWVIADRFELSSFAYQGGGRGVNAVFLNQLSAFCLDNFQADLTFFLDISPENGLARTRGRGEADRIERESIDFFNRVYGAYHQKISSMDNVVIIDAEQPLEDVQQQVLSQLNSFLN
ncbi:thymidylate kinase [Legionella birminghamensis]|uniref:Thymidylate kinase n=1 Tax=Legionella birminghamensis TaxID=28083 RepID=A0A378IAB5_9GAMM|nr:dTMP kinase [Legionella birminghamensis]KTC74385.1 thymidylate kinase [Legionella birminghamensis]STX31700.1 dTMP kinase [Legionella birminghamensis]